MAGDTDGDAKAGGTGGTGGSEPVVDACANDADQAVYDELSFVDGKGEASTGTEAASAIASECVRGSVSSEPPGTGPRSTRWM